MRKRIYDIIEFDENNRLSLIYNTFMFLSIIISIIPLCTHEEAYIYTIIEDVTAWIFLIDYVLRYMTADIRLKRGFWSFVIYPFTIMAIIDLISILPSLSLLPVGYKMHKEFRFLRIFKVFRIFKGFRYSSNVQIIANVFKKKKDSLYVVVCLAFAYILISALIIFNAEPETFATMYDAIYWATISLTTVGYGDLYATTEIGKFITMISAIIGIAIIALPSGIIMSGYQEELQEELEKHAKKEKEKEEIK